MTANLSEDLARFVRDLVQSGRYRSEEELLNDAVSLLKEREHAGKIQASPPSEDEWERRLIESGFLGSAPRRGGERTSPRDFPPIEIEGEPLSETVVRERG
jgi:Arc/MetJ-type ribon-helix-helix transcriptional regulator